MDTHLTETKQKRQHHRHRSSTAMSTQSFVAPCWRILYYNTNLSWVNIFSLVSQNTKITGVLIYLSLTSIQSCEKKS